MIVLPVLFLLGSLFFCGRVEAGYSSPAEILKDAALEFQGPLPCDKWDCNCTFNYQRGCCCGANEMYQVEEHVFTWIKYLWRDIAALNDKVKSLTDGCKVAFQATMGNEHSECYGPFNFLVPIPYTQVSLNDGNAYNPSLGIFTAPCPGHYFFSYTVYSAVGSNNKLYHSVQLMVNGQGMISVWENNREDPEDSGTQVLIVHLKQGDQVYLQLKDGTKLCSPKNYNIFTGYILYPDTDH